MKRTFVIGDVHGSFRALKQLVEKVDPAKSDLFIFLGDFVDGWSQSFEVIEFLLALKEKTGCIFIKGNHDYWCEQWLESGISSNDWLTSGGDATVAGYQQATASQKTKHLEFFRKLRSYYIDDLNRLFIHAGFASVRGPKKERYASSYFWDRSLWETALCLDDRLQTDDKRYPKRLKLFHEIYIGHTPTLHIGRYNPVNAANVWNLDTGAAFNGKLSMLNIDTKELFQSETVMDLYPGEKGRN